MAKDSRQQIIPDQHSPVRVRVAHHLRVDFFPVLLMLLVMALSMALVSRQSTAPGEIAVEAIAAADTFSSLAEEFQLSFLHTSLARSVSCFMVLCLSEVQVARLS